MREMRHGAVEVGRGRGGKQKEKQGGDRRQREEQQTGKEGAERQQGKERQDRGQAGKERETGEAKATGVCLEECTRRRNTKAKRKERTGKAESRSTK